MLAVDVKSRVSIKDILGHQWLNDLEISLMDSNDLHNAKRKEQLKKEGIAMYLEDLGFPQDYIKQTIEKNLFNHVKACVDSLLEKFTSN